jgi:hypothetical protein
MSTQQSSVEATLAERGKRYGDFAEHALIAQNLQDDMRAALGWNALTVEKKQALTVIADKIARILSGDPTYRDNWHDIQGYAKLVEDRLPVQQVEDDGVVMAARAASLTPAQFDAALDDLRFKI